MRKRLQVRVLSPLLRLGFIVSSPGAFQRVLKQTRNIMSKKDPRLEKAGVEGFNKPKKTPSHPTKSHVVVAKEGEKVKTIRFGQQGVSGSPKKEGESKADKTRRESFKARHAENIKKGKMSAAYWASKTKW